MKTSIDNAKDYEKELTRIFNLFNHHFWNDELPEVIITFTGTKKALGHMSRKPVWHAEGKKGKYELNISAYTIDCEPEELCDTLLHEQCHLYNNIHGIVDTSNGSTYHNTEFKKTAEDHGLIVTHDKKTGWSRTELDEKAKKYISTLYIKKFEYKKQLNTPGGNLMRFRCQGCERKTSVYTSNAGINVICGKCGTRLVYDPTKKAPQQ